MEHMQLTTTFNKLSHGVYSIDQGMVRCFLILGNTSAVLFDTGAGPCDLMALIRSVTDLPVTLVQSHGDGDHTANSHLFPEIYAHPAEFPIICRFRTELEDRLRPVKEGDSFDLGGRTLQVIEAPGHTPGSICLLDRDAGILFSGDTVSYGPVFLFGAHRDIRAYRKTLDKLRALGGFDTVYPCHSDCPVAPDTISGLMEVVDRTLDGTLEGAANGDMPMPNGAKPLCYTLGKCGILYIKD